MSRSPSVAAPHPHRRRRQRRSRMLWPALSPGLPTEARGAKVGISPAGLRALDALQPLFDRDLVLLEAAPLVLQRLLLKLLEHLQLALSILPRPETQQRAAERIASLEVR